jgi:hypothetical protein
MTEKPMSQAEYLGKLGRDVKELTKKPEAQNYVCEFIQSEGEYTIYKFNRLSPSEERGYPEPLTTKGYVDCTDGKTRAKWQLIQND